MAKTTYVARAAGLAWSPGNRTVEKKVCCEDELENVLRNMDSVLASANRYRAEKERIEARCQQLESWILSMGFSMIFWKFHVGGGGLDAPPSHLHRPAPMSETSRRSGRQVRCLRRAKTRRARRHTHQGAGSERTRCPPGGSMSEQDCCDRCAQRFPTNAFGIVWALVPSNDGSRLLCRECLEYEAALGQ
jgi:hypothetical protein